MTAPPSSQCVYWASGILPSTTATRVDFDYEVAWLAALAAAAVDAEHKDRSSSGGESHHNASSLMTTTDAEDDDAARGLGDMTTVAADDASSQQQQQHPPPRPHARRHGDSYDITLTAWHFSRITSYIRFVSRFECRALSAAGPGARQAMELRQSRPYGNDMWLRVQARPHAAVVVAPSFVPPRIGPSSLSLPGLAGGGGGVVSSRSPSGLSGPRSASSAGLASAGGPFFVPSMALARTTTSAVGQPLPLPPRPLVVERQVELSTAKLPPALAYVKWWLERSPQMPLFVRAAALTGKVCFGPSALGSSAVTSLDLSGSAHLLDFSLAVALNRLLSLSLSGCERVHFLPSLAGATNLRHVSLSGSGVMDVSELAHCPLLEELSVDRCMNLGGVYGLSGHASLRRILGGDSALVDLSGLSGCTALAEVLLPNCSALLDLAPLAACPALFRLDVSGTGVADVSPLQACRQLEELFVSHCASLSEYKGLSSLVLLEAQSTALRILAVVSVHRPELAHHSVSSTSGSGGGGGGSGVILRGASSGSGSGGGGLDPGSSHRALVKANLSHSGGLRSLSDLASSPSLQCVVATFTAVECLRGLSSCPVLTDLDLSHCIFLGSLAGLAGSPRLRRVALAFTCVASIAELGGCLALEEADLSGCHALTDISPLNACKELRVLGMMGTAATDAVSACPRLTSLDVSRCVGITDLSPLVAGSPGLQRIEGSGCGVESVAFLDELEHVTVARFHKCPNLTDVSPVERVEVRPRGPRRLGSHE